MKEGADNTSEVIHIEKERLVTKIQIVEQG